MSIAVLGPSASKKQFYTLDALRGIAALGVLIGHYPELFRPFNFSGQFAVDLFFAMSGFVIAYSYERRLSDGMTTLEFTLVRLARFYPLYALGTALGLIFAILSYTRWSAIEWSNTGIFWATLSSVFMLPTPQPVTHIATQGGILYPLNPVAWSLFLEMLINVLYATTWRYWTTINVGIWSAISATFIALSIWYFDGMDTGWGSQNFLGGVARVLFSFPVGVLVYRLYRPNSDWGLGSLFFALTTSVLLMVNFRWSLLAQAMIAIGAVPTILWIAIRTEPPDIGRVIARFFGEISYAVYALHFPMIILLLRVLQKIGIQPETLAPWTGIVIVVCFCALCGRLDALDLAIRIRLVKVIRSRSRPIKVA